MLRSSTSTTRPTTSTKRAASRQRLQHFAYLLTVRGSAQDDKQKKKKKKKQKSDTRERRYRYARQAMLARRKSGTNTDTDDTRGALLVPGDDTPPADLGSERGDLHGAYGGQADVQVETLQGLRPSLEGAAPACHKPKSILLPLSPLYRQRQHAKPYTLRRWLQNPTRHCVQK